MRTLAPNTRGSHNHKMQTNSIADFQTPSVESGPQLPERNANRHQKKYDQKRIESGCSRSMFPKIGEWSILGQLTVTSGKRQEMSSV